MKPLIGITIGEVVNQAEPWGTIVYGQKHTYSDAVLAAGGIPLLIPFMPEDELRNLYERLDGIVFAGGNDLHPRLYGEELGPLTVDVSPRRDQAESLLLSWALTDNKPIFAICRGYQLLNVHLGGTLYQDLLTERAHSSDHQISTHKKDYTHIAHRLKIAPDSRLATITQSDVLEANTHHHQGIKQLAPDLQASAWSEDGLIEAVEHPHQLFVMGVQCHPESLHQNDEKWAAVFKSFIDAASTQLIPPRLLTFKKRVKRIGDFKVFQK